MQIVEFSLQGVKLLSLKPHFDDRGFFRQTYQKDLYVKAGIACDFVQDNHSFSTKGVIRGMHFQRRPGQSKLITVMAGEIFDVFVDIRPSSPTFKQWGGVFLSAQSSDQLFIPEGYAHGFCVMSEDAHVSYKVNSFYDPEEEIGFRYDDSEIAIQWPIASPTISLKDRNAVSFREAVL